MHTSNRARRLPGYVVSELAAAKKKLIADGADVIDVSAGDMDLHPPELAVQTLREALADPRMSRYSFETGLTEFREAVANYMERRFGVSVDPMAEVLPLMGSKDGLSHLPLALVDPGDVCIVPEPGYPAYAGGAILANAQLETVSLTSDNGFLLELSELPRDRLAKAGIEVDADDSEGGLAIVTAMVRKYAAQNGQERSDLDAIMPGSQRLLGPRTARKWLKLIDSTSARGDIVASLQNSMWLVEPTAAS